MKLQEAWWFGEIHVAASLAELKQSIGAAVAQLGFRYFIYRGRFPQLRTGLHEICIENSPAGWRKYYQEHGWNCKTDPLRRRALQEITPILWREAVHDAPALFAKAREFGLVAGVTHPVHGPGGQWSCLSFIKNRGGMQAERETLIALPKCQLLAGYVHNAVARHIGRRVGPSLRGGQADTLELVLTERERDCLTWAAAGKTAAEIAALLPIAERTVTFHLTNARRKLGASNSRNAYTAAVALKLIARG